jgi:hypothetical protein
MVSSQKTIPFAIKPRNPLLSPKAHTTQHGLEPHHRHGTHSKSKNLSRNRNPSFQISRHISIESILVDQKAQRKIKLYNSAEFQFLFHSKFKAFKHKRHTHTHTYSLSLSLSLSLFCMQQTKKINEIPSCCLQTLFTVATDYNIG